MFNISKDVFLEGYLIVCRNSKALEVVVPQDKCHPCNDTLLIHLTSL